MKTNPDAIIKKQQKDDYIEKLSDLISQKINNTDDLKKISDKIDFKKIIDKIDLKNEETTQPSYKNDYVYYIKNPNILADKIVEIYDNNTNAKVYNPSNKENNVKLHKVVNRIDKDYKIDKEYKEFVKEFRNIHRNTYIEYDYQTYKNLVLDRNNNEEVSSSNDDSFVKEVSTSNNDSFVEEVSTSNDDSFVTEVGKKFIKNLTGQGVDEYKIIKISKDALKKDIPKIRYNNGRKVNNEYLRDYMII